MNPLPPSPEALQRATALCANKNDFQDRSWDDRIQAIAHALDDYAAFRVLQNRKTPRGKKS